MLIGWGGNNRSTVTATVLANKLKLKWETKEGVKHANYFGSLTQASTTSLGVGADGRDVYIPLHQLLPMVDPNNIEFDGGVTGSAPIKPQLKDLMGALYHKVADRWKTIGVYLEIPSEVLAAIAEKCRDDPHRCLVEMLETWMKRIHPPASWATVIEAVEFWGEEQLGRELRDKHM